MHRLAPKALFAIFTMKTAHKRPNWDRIILLGSLAVSAVLVALYAYGRATGRW
ncbi:hypothetical protein [Bradyrhizobium sp.]|uniref:hypothetical protein n=1 Tax=Bradyrhizobium sp. TaxID=376 RepID=UPI003C5EF90C